MAVSLSWGPAPYSSGQESETSGLGMVSLPKSLSPVVGVHHFPQERVCGLSPEKYVTPKR